MWLLTSVTSDVPASIRTPVDWWMWQFDRMTRRAAGRETHRRPLAFVDVALVDGDVVRVRARRHEARRSRIEQRDLDLPELPVGPLDREHVRVASGP